MSSIIGLWLFALAITILLVWVEDSYELEVKIKVAICMMAFFTLIVVSAIFMAGGVKNNG